MDFLPDAADVSFRAAVIAFLAENLSDDLRMRSDGAQLSKRHQTLSWQRLLFSRGWGAPHWAKEHGGTGWTPQQRLTFDVECALAGAPATNQQGMNLLGPIVNSFGTAEQRARLVSPLIHGETYWCQGFSEPGAGSDLAALQTSAHLEGDRYIVNGQKIWTSHAESADWIFLLVRTSKSPKKQAGISFMVAPIDSIGISVRPIDSIDGLRHLTEVFLENVQIPVANLIGEPGQGWTLAKQLLGKERIFGACDLPGMLRELSRLKGVVARTSASGWAPIDEPVIAHRLSRLDMQAQVTRMAFLRAISSDRSEGIDDVATASILKVQVTELHQKIVEFMYEVLGDRGPLFYPDPMGMDRPPALPGLFPDLSKASSELMYRRASSIYGGTNEIQREVIAKVILAQ